MALVQTARHRALVSARSVRRTRRSSVSQQPARAVAAIQVFVSKLDQFLGVELFSADQPVLVGRHRGVQLRLAADNVSREHLRITLESGVVCVEDLGSVNGTLLNRKKLSGKIDIRPSDTLQIGPYALRLRALLPVEDRALSGVSEAETKVDAVLAATGSKGTEESAVDLASAIDWRIYDEAIRRATGAEPARNVIHLTARSAPAVRGELSATIPTLEASGVVRAASRAASKPAARAESTTDRSPSGLGAAVRAASVLGRVASTTARSDSMAGLVRTPAGAFTALAAPAARAGAAAPVAAPRHDTETRVREPMDEEVAEHHATSRQAPAFLALLRSVTTAQPLPEPETAPELEAPLVGRTNAARMAELERLMARLDEAPEPRREPTRSEHRLPEEEELAEPSESDILAVTPVQYGFAIVPAQSMFGPERDALGTVASSEGSGPSAQADDEGATVTELEAPGAPAVGRRYDSMPMSAEVIARSLLAPAGAGTSSSTSSSTDGARVQARLVTPSIEVAPRSLSSVPVIAGLPTSDVVPAPVRDGASRSTRVPPLPARRVSSMAMRGTTPKTSARDASRAVPVPSLPAPRTVAPATPSQGLAAVSRAEARSALEAALRADPVLSTAMDAPRSPLEAPLVHARGSSVDAPAPSRALLDVPLRASMDAPARRSAEAGRRSAEAIRGTPAQAVAVPVVASAASRSALDVPLAPSRAPAAPARAEAPVAPSRSTPSQGVAAVSRGEVAAARASTGASRGVLALRAGSQQPPALPSTRAPTAAAPARSMAPIAPSRTMSLAPSLTLGGDAPATLIPVAGTVPPPLPSARPSIPVQIPTGPRVTFTPPEALGGSGRVKVSGVAVPPPLPRASGAASAAPVAASEPARAAAPAHVFDGVEITARAGERTLDITTLRKDGDQYVLGHPTPIGAIAPPSAHPGLRLLRIDGNRNVDLVFPREVAGQLIRDGETITLNELTEGRKYSCLRLRGGDVVTVMLGIGPKQVSYHIRFVRAPRSISAVARSRGASAVVAR